MTSQHKTLVNRLLEAPVPSFTDGWNRGQGPSYTTKQQFSQDDIPGLIDIASKWNENWPGDEFDPDLDEDALNLLPVTSCRILGELKAESAVGPLIEVLCESDELDDWVLEELPAVFGKIGAASIDQLTQIATDFDHLEYIRSTAAEGLCQIATNHPHTRDDIVHRLTKMMVDADGDGVTFNSMLLDVLLQLNAVEAAEPIERAFAANYLDLGVCGDWESVRQTLRVEGLGLSMPETPYDSIASFREERGISVFFDRAIFASGESDPEVEQNYYDRAHEAFASSSEGLQFLERYDSLGWFLNLLEFGIRYLGRTVNTMTVASVREFVLEYVPQKVSIEPNSAGAIVAELLAFWKFINRVHKLPAAGSIVEWLETKGLVTELRTELADSSNFGMAKSLFSMGHDAGFDMTSQAGVESFMQAYNESLSTNHLPTASITRDVRVGRNDPCPCGSGKKFKKCCSGSHGL